jgi:hypothetical protein
MGKLSKFEDNQAAWHGDAALSWVTRVVLIESYPKLPLKYLMCRENAIVNNNNLTSYCKKNNLNYGCNVFEKIFGQLTLSNLGRAKQIVRELMQNSPKLKLIDESQLISGTLNTKTLEKIKEKNIRRELFLAGIDKQLIST